MMEGKPEYTTEEMEHDREMEQAETEIAKFAKLTAIYYIVLIGEGVPKEAAFSMTTAWMQFHIMYRLENSMGIL